MYHWKALNWLFKLIWFDEGVDVVNDTRLPNIGDFAAADELLDDDVLLLWLLIIVGMFEYCGFALGGMTDWLAGAPIRLAWNGGGIDEDDDTLASLTGLCVFSWFMDGAGPDSFDLPDSRLSRSMEILPELLHVEPTGVFAVEEVELLLKSSGWMPLLVGWRTLLDGWRMFSICKCGMRLINELLFLKKLLSNQNTL